MGCLLRADHGWLRRLPVAVRVAQATGQALAGRDLDLPRLDLLCLGDAKGQDAVLEGGRCLVRLDAGGQGQRPGEAATANLLEEEALSRRDHRAGVAGNGQGVALDRDVDFLGLDAREDHLDHDVVVGGVDVDRDQLPLSKLPRTWIAKALLEEPVHRLAKREQVAEAAASDECHPAPPNWAVAQSRSGPDDLAAPTGLADRPNVAARP